MGITFSKTKHSKFFGAVVTALTKTIIHAREDGVAPLASAPCDWRSLQQAFGILRNDRGHGLSTFHWSRAGGSKLDTWGSAMGLTSSLGKAPVYKCSYLIFLWKGWKTSYCQCNIKAEIFFSLLLKVMLLFLLPPAPCLRKIIYKLYL